MRLIALRFVFFVAAVVALAPVAQATTPLVSCLSDGVALSDGVYTPFDWGMSSPVTLPYTVVTYSCTFSAALTEVRVLDAYQGGDMFKVEVSGDQKMTLYSSAVPQTIVTSPYGYSDLAQVWWSTDSAWALEAYYSRLAVWLPAGTYSFTITVVQSAINENSARGQVTYWDSGEAFIRVTSASVSSSVTTGSPNVVAPVTQPYAVVAPLMEPHDANATGATQRSRANRNANGAPVR